jgi:hypothetical protein
LLKKSESSGKTNEGKPQRYKDIENRDDAIFRAIL